MTPQARPALRAEVFPGALPSRFLQGGGETAIDALAAAP
ncbi:hypothetical protein HNR00_004012 [Methylorubrum rhodinum]|uniref:Uncharacterized protein n=1 Tax=Methylorubrum rhodinum TaxID=29428 RepID=A0A840ZPL3_9HYPH|nr:hypothetical protein [Methylorubrum rhodinum]